MSKKNRLIILLTCVLLFFIATPYIILYSLGYRIDIVGQRIITTGGIYVRALPLQSDIIIDSKISKTTGLFSSYFFVQNLLPKEHSVSIKKEGYDDYDKNLLVKEKEVTKLENVILFKHRTIFNVDPDKNQFMLLTQEIPQKFTIKNGNLYYADTKENQSLTLEEKKTPVLKKLIAYATFNNTILWLGADGILKTSDTKGNTIETMNKTPFKIQSKKTYIIKVFAQHIFLFEYNNLFLFDRDKKIFQPFYHSATDIILSPDGEKMALINDHEILIHYFNQNLIPQLTDGKENDVLLYSSMSNISDVFWMNNDYLIFKNGQSIVISEIDTRSNTNSITLSPVITPSSPSIDQNIDIKNTTMFFDEVSKKLYLSIKDISLKPAKETVLVSERLVP